MMKAIITLLIIANTSAYPYDEESRIDPPVEPPVLPEHKPLTVVAEPSPTILPDDAKPIYKPEGMDLKTDATFWPFFRTYYYPYYTHRYYRPSIHYRYYYW